MSSPSPVFVYGALRSGTTLLHLMLNGHSRLYSDGEADYLFDHISPDAAGPGGWRYDREALAADRIFRAAEVELPEGQGRNLSHAIVEAIAAKASDKRLSANIHRSAPLMAELFPEAKIIHLLRDPRDVARSSVGMGWCGNSYYGVDHWIETERAWDVARIPSERVLEVRFEELIADLEGQLTRICAFLGLEFDPGMLEYHTQSTYAPPDIGIVQKWRQKAGAREVALLESRVGSLLGARGYETSGTEAKPGAVESLKLAVEHRVNRWRFNIDRYGARLFLGHHLAQGLGLREMAGRMAAEQEDIRVQNLK